PLRLPARAHRNPGRSSRLPAHVSPGPGDRAGARAMSRVERFDSYQRRHTWLGLPLAVIYKFFDDRGSYLAALVTYYAFVSLFPLLLLFYSALGFFLQGDSALRRELEHSVLTN